MHAKKMRATRGPLVRLLVLGRVLVLGLLLAPGSWTWAQESPQPSTAAGRTFVAAPAELEPVLDGETPESLEQLSAMEQQQRQVARLAAACTVSVQIGISQGCGVIITGDGYILTAAHVAMRADRDVTITLADGREVAGRTLGLNREVDAGLIKLKSDTDDGKPWPHATLGQSADLEPGMWCVAMGHPGGYEQSRGVVARVGRILAVRHGAIVTDCALIGGDSGGPLFNLEGELIGVHSRIGNDVADNLHVPVDHYDRSWDRLVTAEAWGFLPGFRPVLGVRGAPDTTVAEIQDVIPGSPAAAAGLKSGDVIERFGDVNISDFNSLKDAVDDTMPGEQIRLRLRRGASVLRVILEIGRDPSS
ncbi:S1C family serine protease [Candidatus Laterigemmans baculatus]|uniref:S1C family serine protease n=1 Tax=Candidatus Laterigemmans baculatus TaxID=2770505 RepID=UPI0013D91032|nr:trypsin-like peptidase domain-containing protein [Candidatus Laterigemmans baculatus]